MSVCVRCVCLFWCVGDDAGALVSHPVVLHVSYVYVYFECLYKQYTNL